MPRQDQKLWGPGLWHGDLAGRPGEGVGACCEGRVGPPPAHRKVGAGLRCGSRPSQDKAAVRPCACSGVPGSLWLGSGPTLPQGAVGALLPLCLNKSRSSKLHDMHLWEAGPDTSCLGTPCLCLGGERQACVTLPHPWWVCSPWRGPCLAPPGGGSPGMGLAVAEGLSCRAGDAEQPLSPAHVQPPPRSSGDRLLLLLAAAPWHSGLCPWLLGWAVRLQGGGRALASDSQPPFLLCWLCLYPRSWCPFLFNLYSPHPDLLASA